MSTISKLQLPNGNSYFLKDSNAISKTIFTEQGQIIYASDVDTPAALSLGSPGKILAVGSNGYPQWISLVDDETGSLNINATDLIRTSGGTITGTLNSTDTINLINSSVTIGTSGNNGVSDSNQYKQLSIKDSNGTSYSTYETIAMTDGNIKSGIRVQNKTTTDADVSNSFYIIANKDGTKSCDFNSNVQINNGNLYTGQTTDTVDRRVVARSQAGAICLYSNGSSAAGDRGIWIDAHGTGSAKYVMRVDTNNNITYSGGTIAGITTITGNTTIEATFRLKNNNVTISGSSANNGVTGDSQWREMQFKDSADTSYGSLAMVAKPDGSTYLSLRAYNKATGSSNDTINYLNIGVQKDGTVYYEIKDSAAFRAAIGADSTYLKLTGGTLTSSLTINNGAVYLKNNTLDITSATNALSTTQYIGPHIQDKNGTWIGAFRTIAYSDGSVAVNLTVRNYLSSDSQMHETNALTFKFYKDGTVDCSTGAPVAWRNALGASSGTWPVSLGGTGATTFTSGAALIGAGTGAITTRSITNNTSISYITANTNLITANTLAYWNGAYDTTGHSNISRLANSVTIYRETTTAQDYSAALNFSIKDTTTGFTNNSAFIRTYQDHSATGDSYGQNMVIASGGNMFIGGGESPGSMYNAVGKNSTGEDLYLTADNAIFLFTNANNTDNRTGIKITTGLNICPHNKDGFQNNVGSIGTSSYKWADIYATKYNGYTIDFNTNNTTDTWVPVLANSQIQHRVLPAWLNSTTTVPVEHGGTGATNTTAYLGLRNLGLKIKTYNGFSTNANGNMDLGLNGVQYQVLCVYADVGENYIFSPFYASSGNHNWFAHVTSRDGVVQKTLNVSSNSASVYCIYLNYGSAPVAT